MVFINFLFESVLLATLKSDIWQSLSCLETLIAYRKLLAHPIHICYTYIKTYVYVIYINGKFGTSLDSYLYITNYNIYKNWISCIESIK